MEFDVISFKISCFVSCGRNYCNYVKNCSKIEKHEIITSPPLFRELRPTCSSATPSSCKVVWTFGVGRSSWLFFTNKEDWKRTGTIGSRFGDGEFRVDANLMFFLKQQKVKEKIAKKGTWALFFQFSLPFFNFVMLQKNEIVLHCGGELPTSTSRL